MSAERRVAALVRHLLTEPSAEEVLEAEHTSAAAVPPQVRCLDGGGAAAACSPTPRMTRS